MKSAEVTVGAFYQTRGSETVRVVSRGTRPGYFQVYASSGAAFAMSSRDLLHTVPDPAAPVSAGNREEARADNLLHQLIADVSRNPAYITSASARHRRSLAQALREEAARLDQPGAK